MVLCLQKEELAKAKYKELARTREKGSDRADRRGQSPIIYFLPGGGMHVGGWLILQVVSSAVIRMRNNTELRVGETQHSRN